MFRRVWRWAGTFRTTARNIGVDASQINISAQQLIGNARYWIEHGTFSADEIFARLHHRLVQIHCFPNGNGRHARAITDLAMLRHSAKLFTWGQSIAGENARRAYIASLQAADAGDFAALLVFVRQ